ASEIDSSPPAMKRQINAFAPNFVHSLDSTHLLMTAADCSRKGLAFAGVHDSFWTHASDADILAASLRQQFVDLHSQPIITDLHRQLSQRYGLMLPEPPAPGDFN